MKHFLSRFVPSLRPPLVVVAGSTASGKTSFSIQLAQQLIAQGQGIEIISADSRQIYRGMTNFTGAIRAEEMQGIVHHLVETVDPQDTKDADWFRTQAGSLIQQIRARGNLPIVVGGTGFWIQTLLFQDDYPAVPPNDELRQELSQCDIEQLHHRLQQLDPQRFAQIDTQNPRRLIRSIEIATALGHVPAMKYTAQNAHNIHLVYFDYPLELVRERINANVHQRFTAGLIAEAHDVYQQVTSQRFAELGLAYKYLPAHWAGELSVEELEQKTAIEEYRYAKRQKTFFKKMITRSRAKKYTITNQSQKDQIRNQLLRCLV